MDSIRCNTKLTFHGILTQALNKIFKITQAGGNRLQFLAQTLPSNLYAVLPVLLGSL